MNFNFSWKLRSIFSKGADSHKVLFYFVPNSSPSPRSIEACRRQGIHPKELIVRSMDEIKALYKEKDIYKATMEQRARHFEDRRREKIKILLDIWKKWVFLKFWKKDRQQLIEEETKPLEFQLGRNVKRGFAIKKWVVEGRRVGKRLEADLPIHADWKREKAAWEKENKENKASKIEFCGVGVTFAVLSKKKFSK